MKYTIVSSDAEMDEIIEKKNYILSNMISSFFFSSLAFGLLIYIGLNVNWIFSEANGIVIVILIFGIVTLLFGLRDIFKLRKTIKKIKNMKKILKEDRQEIKKKPCFMCGNLFPIGELIIYIDASKKGVFVCSNCFNSHLR